MIKLDDEILGAVSGSVRAIIDNNDENNKDTIKALALEAIKNSLKSYPKYAIDNVFKVFNARIRAAEEIIRHNLDNYPTRLNRNNKKITMDDLLT